MWQEELERLREEQRPKPCQQPFLRLPLPMPDRDDRQMERPDDPEDRGVIYLDM